MQKSEHQLYSFFPAAQHYQGVMVNSTDNATVVLRQMTGAPVSLALPPASTVDQLKKLVEAKTAVAADSQRIVFSGRELDNQRPLSFYAVQCGVEYTMHLVLKTKGIEFASGFPCISKLHAYVRHTLNRTEPWRVFVKTLKDCTFAVDCDATSTVLEVKHRVAEQDAQWEVQRQRIILHGKELEDKSRLSECGLDDEAPTVHLVMRLPAPGTARRKRDPVVGVKGGVGTPGGQMVKVKAEPDEDEELAAMNGAGIRQLSDMLLDGDQMEFDQAWQEYEQMTHVAPVWDVEAGLGPRGKVVAVAVPSSNQVAQEIKPMDTTEVNLFLAPAPAGISATPSPKAAGTPLAADSAVPSEAPVGPSSSSSGDSVSPAGGSRPSAAAQAALAVDIDEWSGDRSMVPSTQGRAYDLDKVDEKLRKRLLKNRLSAERSRQRKQAHVETLEFELSCCRSENEHLKKRVAVLESQTAMLEAQVASLSINTFCKPDQSFSRQELTVS